VDWERAGLIHALAKYIFSEWYFSPRTCVGPFVAWIGPKTSSIPAYPNEA
jgi:hypothetical protein